MALPVPGCKKVPCEVEIEVPAELNGFRLYLLTPRREPYELAPGTTHCLYDFGDGRDTEGQLVAVPSRDLEFVEQGEPLADVILNSLPERRTEGTTVTLRVYLHYLDPRSKATASYRVDRVTAEGHVAMTVLHVDGGWTGWLCLATFGVLLAIIAFFLGLEVRRWLRPEPPPPMPTTPPMVRLDPDEE